MRKIVFKKKIKELKMDNSLLDLLRESSTDSNEFTHVSLYGPKKN